MPQHNPDTPFLGFLVDVKRCFNALEEQGLAYYATCAYRPFNRQYLISISTGPYNKKRVYAITQEHVLAGLRQLFGSVVNGMSSEQLEDLLTEALGLKNGQASCSFEMLNLGRQDDLEIQGFGAVLQVIKDRAYRQIQDET